MSSLRHLLARRKITKARFRFPLTTEQAVDVLTASYQVEVEYRGRAFSADAQTAGNIRRVAECLTAEKPRFGILLCGMSGNGKTTMLYAFRSALNWMNDSGMFSDRRTGMRIEFAKDITASARQQEYLLSIRGLPMLAIEDMGREPTEVMDYGNVTSPVVDLLEYRYDNQLFTFITTNLTPKEIREKYGTRIADRFNEMLNVIIFKNQTYRK